MGRICFAEGDLGKAVQLLRKVNAGCFCYIFSQRCKQNVRGMCMCVYMYLYSLQSPLSFSLLLLLRDV